jgi:glycine/D-amino acid oxidase-like deaminating enzyme
MDVTRRFAVNLKSTWPIVGGGFTGILVGLMFAEPGVRVAVFERALIGGGSTAASTALLMQEPDRSFRELAHRFDTADRPNRVAAEPAGGQKPERHFRTGVRRHRDDLRRPRRADSAAPGSRSAAPGRRDLLVRAAAALTPRRIPLSRAAFFVQHDFGCFVPSRHEIGG